MSNQTPIEALQGFEFCTPLDSTIIDFLEKQGYERRSGDCNYTKTHIVIVPFKKWYWTQRGASGIQLKIKKQIRETYHLELK